MIRPPMGPSLPSVVVLVLLAAVGRSIGITPTPTISTSTNDLFHDIAKQITKPPEPPICCLKPLPSVELTEEFLSFEDWKAKQALLQTESNDSTKQATVVNNVLDVPPEPQADPGQPTASAQEHTLPTFPVPLTDRFNYASLDCSARIHHSHRSAKSPWSILSSKKDRYMLSPCNPPSGEQKYVVVELCDDIRIDTVQLANFEFFSGVFKEFTVSVMKTRTTDPESWTFAGTYKAKNIRGVQSFHPPESLRDFYRYIRIDFLSHYGNEYYCPVSLLRVYGLTHLEEWKREVWEQEHRDRHSTVKEPAAVASIVTSGSGVPQQEVVPTSEGTSGNGTKISSTLENPTAASVEQVVVIPEENASDDEHSTPPLPATKDQPTTTDTVHATESPPEHIPDSTGQSDSTVPSSVELPSVSKESSVSISSSIPTSDHSPPIPSSIVSSVSFSGRGITSAIISTTPHGSVPSVARNTSLPASNTLSSSTRIATSSHPDIVHHTVNTASSVSASVPTVAPHPAPPMVSPGESIFRTIMTRLSILEANSTLYARYVEEQTRSMREALRRLEEDIGRIEGIGKAQAQFYHRSMIEWDRQRKRLEREHGELLTRIDFLSDEIVLEKRLGIAQLCLLLIVLFFIALTRGSRGEAIAFAANRRHDSIKAWGRKQLSGFGSDWTSRFRNRSGSSGDEMKAERGPSQSPAPAGLTLKSDGENKYDGRITFPLTHTSRHRPHHIGHRTLHNIARPHTPSFRGTASRLGTPASVRRPLTPTQTVSTPLSYAFLSSSVAPPLLRRANSTTPVTTTTDSRGNPISLTLSPVPSSAKRFARTAHLHEIRLGQGRRAAKERDAQKEAQKSQNAKEENMGPSGPLSAPSNLLFASDVFWNASPSTNKPSENNSPRQYQDSPTREPLAPMDNSPSILSAPQLGSPWSPHTDTAPGRVKTIVDGDPESESWIDTDVEGEGSDTGGVGEFW